MIGKNLIKPTVYINKECLEDILINSKKQNFFLVFKI